MLLCVNSTQECGTDRKCEVSITIRSVILKLFRMRDPIHQVRNNPPNLLPWDPCFFVFLHFERSWPPYCISLGYEHHVGSFPPFLDTFCVCRAFLLATYQSGKIGLLWMGWNSWNAKSKWASPNLPSGPKLKHLIQCYYGFRYLLVIITTKVCRVTTQHCDVCLLTTCYHKHFIMLAVFS